MDGQCSPIVVAQRCSARGLLIVQYRASTNVAAGADGTDGVGSDERSGRKNFFALTLPFRNPVHPADSIGTIGTNGIGDDAINIGRVTPVGSGISPPSDIGLITLFLRQVICEEYRCVKPMILWTSAPFSLIPNPFSLIPRLCLSYNLSNLTKMVIGMG